MSIVSKEKETPSTPASPTATPETVSTTSETASTSPETDLAQESPEEEIKEIAKTGEVLIEKIKIILDLLPKFWARVLKLINRFSKKGSKK